MLRHFFFYRPSSTFRHLIKRAVFFEAVLFATYLLTHELFSWASGNCRIPYAPVFPREDVLVQGLIVSLVQLVALGTWAGLLQGLLRYFRMPDIFRTIASLLVVFAAFFFLAPIPAFSAIVKVSRCLLCLDFLCAIFAICAIRAFFRIIWERKVLMEKSISAPQKRVAIFGAGDAGAELAATLITRPNLRKKPVVFFDDDPAKKNLSIVGIPVIGPLENLAECRAQYNFDDLILAIPSGNISRVRELRKIAVEAGLEVSLIPSWKSFLAGTFRFPGFDVSNCRICSTARRSI